MKKSDKKTKVKDEVQEPEIVEEAVDQDTADPETSEPDPLVKELEETKAKRDEYLDMAQRARAEFENYRKRNLNVRADALAEGKADAIASILPILDNLERAVASGGEGAFFDGVSLVIRQFHDILSNMGVTEIPCEPGEVFDPMKHNAVLRGPADEDHPEGTVLQVFQKGYQIKEKILRHTMVQVANQE